MEPDRSNWWTGISESLNGPISTMRNKAAKIGMRWITGLKLSGKSEA
jgi:hypothetical protein